MNGGPTLACAYFDGASARSIEVLLQLQLADLVVLAAQSPFRELARTPAEALDWPEQTSAPARMLSLPGGASLQCKDAPAWDAWVQNQVPNKPTAVQRMQRQWRWALVCVAVFVGLLAAVQIWGIAAFSRVLVAALPMSADAALGEKVWPQVEGRYLKPSSLGAGEEKLWQTRMQAMVGKAYPAGKAPHYELVLRASQIGPNAFALPGGKIVLTDELVKLARREPELAEAMVLGVLAHELGHVKARHGMRHLVSALSLSALSAWLLGDVSGVLSSLHLALGQASYSRDAEREADDTALEVMQRAGISPLAMAKFFQLVRQVPIEKQTEACAEAARKRLIERRATAADSTAPTGSEIQEEAAECVNQAKAAAKSAQQTNRFGIAFSSHPADAERVRKFEAAGR